MHGPVLACFLFWSFYVNLHPAQTHEYKWTRIFPMNEVNNIKIKILYFVAHFVNYFIFRIEKQMPYDHPLNVWHTGEVLWVTQAIYKSPCDVKTYNFPFDVHVCNFTFASWTHSEHQLNLTFYENQDKILQMSYYNNPQWEIEVRTIKCLLFIR